MRAPCAVLALTLMAGCHHAPRATTPPAPAEAGPGLTFSGKKVRSYTDTFAITSIADSPTTLWAGTPRGLLKWDVASRKLTVLGAREGLPTERVAQVALDPQRTVWAATEKAIVHSTRQGWQSFPIPPVGDFITGLQAAPDGKSVWVGGPEGLAHLRNGKWERFLADVSITAMATQPNGVLWIGTSGRGILRIPRAADKVEAYGPAQGCETDVVRALAVTDKNVLAFGEGPAGPRAAFIDNDRCFSYSVEAPQVIEWAAQAGPHTYLGAGSSIWELTTVEPQPDKPPPEPSGPVRLKPSAPAPVRKPRPVPLKPDLPATALDEPAPTGPPTALRVPLFDTVAAPFGAPDGVTVVGSSERGLLVGTRFLGAVRVENGVPRLFRVGDLSAGAERLTVACKGGPKADDCWLATGAAKAWHFSDEGFEIAPVDPEPGSRVLATLRDAKGAVMAIHRAPTEAKNASQLRISAVENGNWTPVSIQEVAVPNGPPLLNFALFAPDGHLWVGLRYIDKENDPIDYGAAEVDVDSGKVVYHRQGPLDSKTTLGVALPSDTVAMYFRSAKESWFATRSGAARLLDGKVRVFTAADGLESELITDIDGGPQDEVWVASARGTGRWDGKVWRFPRLGPYYLKATSLAHDDRGHTFIGTEKGLFCVGDCDPDAIDQKRGLLDDAVLDLTVDQRGRVWVLTAKGVSIVEP
jgi:hypothetical protein